ncbi:hypothetical protein B4U80_08932, partial [Leptotrombidium deliense]
MIQLTYTGRAYKRFIYFVFVWTCVCFVVFRFAVNRYAKSKHLEYSNAGSHSQRGLLQNVALDYASGFVISAVGTTTAGRRSGDKQQSNSENEVNVLNSNPQVDASHSLSEQELYLKLANISNIPLIQWSKVSKKVKSNAKSGNKSCKAEFPSVFEIDFNNIYWQRMQTTNSTTFYLYGAYYDDRWRGGALASVRILAMIDRITPPPVVCQFWFESIPSPIFANATYIYGWYSKWGNYKDGALQPFIISCKVPRIKGVKKDVSPDSVSLVQSKCDKASNNLRVVKNRPKVKEEFA